MLAVLGRLFLVDRENLAGVFLRLVKVDVPGMPEKCLEELVCILFFDHEAGGLDDIARVLNELATLRREFRLVYGRRVEEMFEGPVDLLVRGVSALAEGLDDAIEPELED